MTTPVLQSGQTAIKICGLTCVDDVRAAVAAGAAAIGLVFYAASPRAVNVAQAVTLCREIPPFVARVGLFVDAPVDEINAVLAAVPLSLLQFHGEETASYCESFARPYIKALRLPVIAGGADVAAEIAAAMAAHPNASGFLLDSYQPGLPGGTGVCFDWRQVPDNIQRPLVLAGGLTPDNVARAIDELSPYAVDVSSGVEQRPGEKSRQKIEAFVAAVRAARVT